MNNSCTSTVWILHALYAVVAVSALVLGATGAYALFQGTELRGYALMAHTSLGGLFAVALALFAVFYAERCRFVPDSPYRGGQSLCFWLLLLLGAMSGLSIVLCMMPLAGTHGQHLLVAVHRYCAYGIAVVAVAHLYYLVLGKKAPSRA